MEDHGRGPRMLNSDCVANLENVCDTMLNEKKLEFKDSVKVMCILWIKIV